MESNWGKKIKSVFVALHCNTANALLTVWLSVRSHRYGGVMQIYSTVAACIDLHIYWCPRLPRGHKLFQFTPDVFSSIHDVIDDGHCQSENVVIRTSFARAGL